MRELSPGLRRSSRDTYFPSLFHNSALATGGGRNLVAAILFGVNRETPQGLAFMPGFGGKPADIAALSNVQIAALSNYLLQHYGNPNFRITPDFVQQVREGKAPTPLLVTLVTLGEWGAGLLVLAVLAWFVGRRFIGARAKGLST